MLTQYRRSLLAALCSCAALLAIAPAAQAVSISAIATPFTGAPSAVQIVLTQSGSDILVNVSVIQDHGDIRAVYFNISDDSLLPGLSVTGDDVTEFELDTIDLGNGSNLIGGGSPCPCDFGVEIGTQGSGQDYIEETEFTISHSTLDLDLELFTSQTFGVRLTGVGPEICFDESSKLKGVFPTEVPEPTTGLLFGLGLGLVGLAKRRLA